jgi:hypothetical protein
MKTIYILIAFFISIFNMTLEAANSYTVNQNNTISLTTGYVDNMNETWNVVSTVTDKPLVISYTIGTESNYDYLTINNVDNSGNVTSQLIRISGTKSGAISTITPNGRVQIVFTSDGSVSYANNPGIYSGINVTFSVNNNQIINNGLFVTGNSYFNDNVGIGTISPTQKLDVIGNLAVGTINKITIMDFPGQSSWIDMPAVPNKASGIGSGGAGNNLWIGYAGYPNHWFAGSNVGDICYRNTIGKLLFGNLGSSPATMAISGGKVGIGTINPDALLTVNGIIHAKEIKVDLTGSLADFVFHPTYKLMPLHEVEQFVKTNSHLPEIPSAAEVSKYGMNMGEMQNKLLQKIEELTLYMIEQQKQIEELKASLNPSKGGK